jgi:inosine-uridine nucleoside N-ribohydrolase
MEQSTNNTLKILSMAALTHIKVFKGSEIPLLRNFDPRIGEEIHGENGLGNGVFIPDARMTVQEGNAIHKLYECLKASPEKVTICATACLTNIALLLMTFPDSVQFIKKLVIMGGSLSGGNCSPHAEYNFYCDAEAA